MLIMFGYNSISLDLNIQKEGKLSTQRLLYRRIMRFNPKYMQYSASNEDTKRNKITRITNSNSRIKISCQDYTFVIKNAKNRLNLRFTCPRAFIFTDNTRSSKQKVSGAFRKCPNLNNVIRENHSVTFFVSKHFSYFINLKYFTNGNS